MNERTADEAWRAVFEFWFPEGRSFQIEANAHNDHWFWRMRGGVHDEVTKRFSELTAEGAAGNLGFWVADPERRLALIIVLDQFSRSVWGGSARAFAQDPAALALAMEGLSNGHYAALPIPWFKVVHGRPLGHCEGPDRAQHIVAQRTVLLCGLDACVVDRLSRADRICSAVPSPRSAAGPAPGRSMHVATHLRQIFAVLKSDCPPHPQRELDLRVERRVRECPDRRHRRADRDE